MKVTQHEAKQAIAVSLLADAPALVWGMPGIGKSSFIHQLGEKLGYRVHVVIGSLCDPTDIKGLPFIDGSSVKFARPYFITDALESKRVILFFDELTLAPKTVRDAIMRLVLERAIDDVKLPPETRIIAAANPPEVAEGWDLTLPLANRFVHIQYSEPNANEIASYFRTGQFPTDDEIADRLVEVWEAPQENLRRKWGNIIGTYLEKVNPPDRFRLPKEGTEFPDNLAYPTPRTWDYLVKLMAAADLFLNVGEKDYRFTGLHSVLASGTVGFGAAKAFSQWMTELDVPDIDELVEGKVQMPVREDVQILIISTLASNFASQYLEFLEGRKEHSTKLNKILKFVSRLHSQKRHDLSYLFISFLNSQLREGKANIGSWFFNDMRPAFVPAEFLQVMNEVLEVRKKLSQKEGRR